MWTYQIIDKKLTGTTVHITVEFTSKDRMHEEIFNLPADEIESLEERIVAVIKKLEDVDKAFKSIKVVPRPKKKDEEDEG